MAIDFPNSPTNGQIYTVGDKSWIWDGTVWKAYGASLSPTVLKVDSTNTRVGINNQSPAYTLDVNGTVEATQFIQGTDYLTPYTGFRNKIINGNMLVDQRGSATTAVVGTGYVTDRWYMEDGCDAVFSSQQSTDVPTGQGFTKSLKVTSTTADASIGSTQYAVITQFIEGSNVADLAWGSSNAQTVVVSFWVKASVTGTYSLTLYNNGASRICPTAYTINASNTWEKKTVVVAGDTSGTWLTDTGRGIVVNFYTALGSTYLGTSGVWNGSSIYGVTGQANAWSSTNNIFAITGVQVERGSVATPFEQRPIGTELALCQRYYWRIIGNASNKKRIPSCGSGYSSGGSWQGQIFTPVTMRIAPTALEWSSVGFTDNVSFDSTAFVTLTIPAESSGDCPMVNGTGASNGAAYTGVNLILIGGSSYFALSSEF